jgi:3-methylcrotonyl-CoA carboxylase beta subunit
MPILQSRLDVHSAEFRANADALQAQVGALQATAARAVQGGDQRSRDRHVARGKLLPRDRVDTLLDPGSPFLEIGQLAAHAMYDGDAPSAGMVCGIGRVHGQEVMVVANDATV